MLLENLALLLDMLFNKVCMDVRGDKGSELDLRVGLELVSFGSEVDG